MKMRDKEGYKKGNLKFLTVVLTFVLIFSSFPMLSLAGDVDKASLTSAINAEFSDSERTTYMLTEAHYTLSSWTTYVDSITAAIAVEVNAEATQQNVDDAIYNLESAKVALIFANQASLDSAITAAGAKVEAYFTPASWASFISAKNAAYSLPHSTFEEINSKINAINTAMGLLVYQRYTITFDSKGGSAVSSKTALYNMLITTPATPIKAGHVFAGWYRQSACTVAWNFSKDKVTGNTTLYAKWTTAPKVSIKVQTNNSTYGTVAGGGSYYNDKVTKATIRATPKNGYRFVRWLEGTKVVSTSYKYSFVATKARTFKAEFAKIGTPSIKVASAGYNKIKISWSAIAGAKEYRIYRATSSGGKYTYIGSTTALSFTNSGLTTGKTYYYKVRVKCTAGVSTYGSYSAIKSAKSLLSKLTGLTTASASYRSIKLSWTAVPGATKYRIYRATSKTGKYTTVTYTDKLTYTDSGRTAGKTYYYKVRAYRLVGKTKVYGSYSSIKSIRPIPSAPKSVTASSGPNSVTIKWAAVSGATKYQIYRATSKTGTYTKITDTDKLTYKDTGRTAGKTYYYKVRAYRLVGKTKVYGSFCTVVSAISRKPLTPNYSIINPSQTKSNTGSVGFFITNNGTKTMRVYNDSCYLRDNDYYSFNRHLQLIDSESFKDISYIDIPAGDFVFVFFRVIGDKTWYDSESKVFFSFSYDTIKYRAATSYYWGDSYWLK